MNKISKIVIIALLIILFFIMLFLFTGKSFSNFFSKITGNSTTQTAKPVFVLENSEKKYLNDEHTEIDYYFTVKNFDNNNNRSQTDLLYTIEITPQLNSSIILTLYKDNKIINLKNQKTENIQLVNSNNETHSYRLNVKYDRDRTNSTTDIKQNIFIKASAIQG